jgi:hypothetical protein
MMFYCFFRIHLRQCPVKISRIVFLFLIELLSELRIRLGLGQRIIPIDGIDIESGSSHDKRKLSGFLNIFNDVNDVFLPLSGGIHFIGIYDIYLMMWDFFANG